MNQQVFPVCPNLQLIGELRALGQNPEKQPVGWQTAEEVMLAAAEELNRFVPGVLRGTLRETIEHWVRDNCGSATAEAIDDLELRINHQLGAQLIRGSETIDLREPYYETAADFVERAMGIPLAGIPRWEVDWPVIESFGIDNDLSETYVKFMCTAGRWDETLGDRFAVVAATAGQVFHRPHSARSGTIDMRAFPKIRAWWEAKG